MTPEEASFSHRGPVKLLLMELDALRAQLATAPAPAPVFIHGTSPHSEIRPRNGARRARSLGRVAGSAKMSVEEFAAGAAQHWNEDRNSIRNEDRNSIISETVAKGQGGSSKFSVPRIGVMMRLDGIERLLQSICSAVALGIESQGLLRAELVALQQAQVEVKATTAATKDAVVALLRERAETGVTKDGSVGGGIIRAAVRAELRAIAQRGQESAARAADANRASMNDLQARPVLTAAVRNSATTEASSVHSKVGHADSFSPVGPIIKNRQNVEGSASRAAAPAEPTGIPGGLLDTEAEIAIHPASTYRTSHSFSGQAAQEGVNEVHDDLKSEVQGGSNMLRPSTRLSFVKEPELCNLTMGDSTVVREVKAQLWTWTQVLAIFGCFDTPLNSSSTFVQKVRTHILFSLNVQASVFAVHDYAILCISIFVMSFHCKSLLLWHSCERSVNFDPLPPILTTDTRSSFTDSNCNMSTILAHRIPVSPLPCQLFWRIVSPSLLFQAFEGGVIEDRARSQQSKARPHLLCQVCVFTRDYVHERCRSFQREVRAQKIHKKHYCRPCSLL